MSGVPDHVLELVFDHLRISDCAACCCASQELNALGKVSARLSCNGSKQPGCLGIWCAAAQHAQHNSMLLDCLDNDSVSFQHIMHNDRDHVLPFCVLGLLSAACEQTSCSAGGVE